MFDNITNKLQGITSRLQGRAKFAQKQIDEICNDIRISLIEADVALPAVRQMIDDIRIKIGDPQTATSDDVYKAIKQSLFEMVGGKSSVPLRLTVGQTPPQILMVTGVYGAGKTTTCGKLAKWLTNEMKAKCVLVSTDTIRQGAQSQLQQLAEQVGCEFLQCPDMNDPVSSAQILHRTIKSMKIDFAIWDTAGRNVLDADLLSELSQIHTIAKPTDTILVLDSLTGQSALTVANTLNNTIKLTGLIMTKMDSDTRGGATLSARYATNVNVSFFTTGEKLDDIELMIPERFVNRIMGEGDLQSLAEQIQKLPNREKMEKMAKQSFSTGALSLVDFRDQLVQIKKMGGLSKIAAQLPGMSGALPKQMDSESVVKNIAVIDSMTPQERMKPQIINSSRKKRIYKGAGTLPVDVSRLLNQHKKMSLAMKKMKKMGGVENMMDMLGVKK